MTSSPAPDRRVMIVLAYLWPLALIPLVLDKQDAEVQWHAKHGIVLMVAELLLLLLLTITATIVSLAVLGIGWVISIFSAVLWLGILGVQVAIVVLHGIAMARGLNGGRLMVPGVSEFASRF